MRINKVAALAAATVLGAVAPLAAMPAAHADDGGYLLGRVVDAAGHGLPNVEVDFANGTTSAGSATTDWHGYYRLADSNATITKATPVLTGMTGTAASGTWKIPANGNVAGPTLKMTPTAYTAPTTYSLTGTVLASSGAPLSNVQVGIYSATGEYEDTVRTHGDGRYYATGLTAGSYKVEADVYADGSASPNGSTFWYGGAKSFAAAPAVAVGTKTSIGAIAVGIGTITGTITLPPVAAGDWWYAMAYLYDLDGNVVGEGRTDAAGRYSIDSLPGTYYLEAEGEESSGPDSAPDQGYFPMISQWWSGGFSMATATPITIGANGTVTANFALGRTILATAAPTVSGKLKAHRTLTVSTGTWNHRSDVVYTYVWRRGATVVGTGPAYRLSKTDVKAVKLLKKAKTKKQLKKAKKLARATQITVTVTASDAYNNLAPGSITVSGPTAKSALKGGKHGKKHHH